MRIGQELEATLPLEDFRTRTVTLATLLMHDSG